ncbi:metal ABC transporter substrate-binding protein [Aminipila luticellarii]|uniref:Zinc ABC transporter substrate-binding protein n=1 Tax=Aminipila luticellarii TaxID=2507160 RepID=A0A410PVP2_9FIRM|nr:metal ABC transporter substrate-binding protein [Aminipila luticellarii]QAT42936.1 zinc ABC transporter substrate-binding protein [Aminipila luticellarii]
MKKLNKVFLIVLIIALAAGLMSSCSFLKSNDSSQNSADAKKLNVVATIFPEYDFLRQIGGDYLNLTMLLSPGAESHSFEPTPQDIKDIQKSDMFVYVGGDSDEWVANIMDSVDSSKTKIVTLMDCVDLAEEEVVEGMTPEEEEEPQVGEAEPEYDEHVWTSPKNTMKIVQKLCDNLCELDPEHAEAYKQNTKQYLSELEQLDGEFQDVVDQAKRKEIIVADRFPFRYFADEYGLTYYAAFPGCSTDTEANAATIAFLTNKVKQDKIPVVFHIELSNEKICDSICETTGAKSELLNAVHNVSRDDFESGVTYIDLMKHNVEALKEALN